MKNQSTWEWGIRLLALALFSWNALQFTRALRSNFSRPEGVPPLMRLLAICGLMTIAVDVYLFITQSITVLGGLLAVGLLLASWRVFGDAVRATQTHRLSLAFSQDAPAHLNREGIYARIRHPFYLAYTLNWLGAGIATWHWAAITMLGVMVLFYLLAAVREEQKFLNSPLVADYRRYRETAGMFLPNFLAITKTNQNKKP